MPPLFAAAGAAIGGIIGGSVLGISAATIGSAIAQVAGGLVLSGIARALTPSPDAQRPGVETREVNVTRREPAAAREIVYGTVRKGGTIIYADTNEDGKFLDVVIVLAGHEVEEIGAVYFDGVKGVEADGTTLTGNMFSEAGNLTVQVQKRTGYPNQPAFTILGSSAWTPDHVLAGCAAIAVRMRDYNGEFPNGLPNITVDVVGKNDVLDPRTGTRGWTDNAALCIADYMMMERYGLDAQLGEDIDEDILIASANICDEAVTLRQGGTEARYTINGVVSLDGRPRDIIEDMATAMAGDVVSQHGVWRIYAGAYRSPSLTLTADDLIEGGISARTRVSAAENFNGVKGLFVSPEDDWQPTSFPAYISGYYRTLDGGFERIREIDLPFTTSASAAQRIARIVLEKVRRQITVEVTGKLSCWRFATGETLAFDYPRFGWVAKPFDVDAMRLELVDGQLVVRMTLRETSPLVYDWDATKQEIQAAAPRTSLPDRFAISPPATVILEEELYVTRVGGGAKSRVQVSWSQSTSGYVDRYEVEFRRTAASDGTATGDDWRTLGFFLGFGTVLPDVQPGTWEVRVRALSFLGVPSEWVTGSAVIAGLGAAPAALSDVTIQSSAGLAVIKWGPISDIDVLNGGRVLIRHASAQTSLWGNSRSLDAVAGANRNAVVPLLEGYYLLRAEDGSGNLGPVTSIYSAAATVVAYTQLASRLGAPTWPDVRVNAEIDGDALTLTDPALEGSYTFNLPVDLGTVKAVRLRARVEIVGININDTFFGGTEQVFQGSGPVFGDDVFGADAVVEASITDDDPAASPTWSDWFRVDNAEVSARGVRFRLRFSVSEPDTTMNVEVFSAFVEEIAA